MSHDPTLIRRICEDLEKDYDPSLYEYVIERPILKSRMFPDVATIERSSGIFQCVVEIGYTRPEKVTAYREQLKIPDVRWYCLQGILHVRWQQEPHADTARTRIPSKEWYISEWQQLARQSGHTFSRSILNEQIRNGNIDARKDGHTTIILTPPNNFLPDRLVGERYGRSVKTIERWEKDPALGFPPVIYLRKRRYRSAAALDAWDAKQRGMAGAAA
jgi:hypothetical protein